MYNVIAIELSSPEFTVVESGEDLDRLILRQVRNGWEDRPEVLPKGLIIIVDDAQKVVATITWVESGLLYPDLITCRVGDNYTRRYRYVETVGGYDAAEIA